VPAATTATLVLHGGDDPTVIAANGRALASRIPNARLEVVDGAGHLLLFDEPERAAPLIEDFLDT
jgi:pimeloyl-ACP methyl ester carboxylesterase